ncbi:hypothetical protein Sango_0588700 [Sesamum angolense]|uniref:CCHC-type domain-containing protein n=1 Tax=Sesamum angolense TaxID=2727404 RepID=A0AAE1X6N5_9LAMI|nr:hypothetical protein Sango_0588700 [Sesamum angolense]
MTRLVSLRQLIFYTKRGLWGELSSCCVGSPMNSRICLFQDKGKEKAVSDGGVYDYGRSSNDGDDSMRDKKKHDCENPSMGFQTMFKSLYCRNTKMSDSVVQKDHSSTEESKALKVADMKSIENLPRSCGENNDNSCKQIILSEKEMQRIAATSDASFELKPVNKLSPAQLSPELRSSEAMTSVFAKRLTPSSIKHPSEKRKSSTSTLKCFFCGQSGHDLRKCLELTDTELNDLLLCADNEASHPGRDNDDNKQVAARLMACSRSKSCLDSPNEYQKSTALNSENDLKDKQSFPPYNFINAQSAVVPEEMFQAIRKLRMSRADILRWMSSDVSLPHLNGFFLRLRLTKLEAGLGGTGYYVARITGDTAATIHCKFKNSIFVDVAGIKSSVGSRYVSNHDFLEDEIKAWWTRIANNGGQMPSLHELSSKFVDRKRLEWHGHESILEFVGKFLLESQIAQPHPNPPSHESGFNH